MVRDRRLRWPIAKNFEALLRGATVRAVERRAKYILLRFDSGTAIIHLGMSGSLRLVEATSAVKAHDHWDMVLQNGLALRFHDPRRFGSMLWTDQRPCEHPLLARLAPEPLGSDFDGDYLFRVSRRRKVVLKALIMNSQLVVGVGNIYASEALFRACLSPSRVAGRLSRDEAKRLAQSIKDVLREAIRVGGTTLRDYVNADGAPGYFRQKLFVYERAGKPCRVCGTPIKQSVHGQRSTYRCPQCQK